MIIFGSLGSAWGMEGRYVTIYVHRLIGLGSGYTIRSRWTFPGTHALGTASSYYGALRQLVHAKLYFRSYKLLPTINGREGAYPSVFEKLFTFPKTPSPLKNYKN